MANYDANIRVNADTKQAESKLTKLEQVLNKLGDFTLKLDSRGLQGEVNKIGQSLRGIGERGALGGITLAAGKATTALGGVAAKFGIVGAAAASAGATINSALGGVPAVVGDILNQVGQIPSAMGLAAVAAMAFAPQLTKAAAGAVKLGAAIDNAVGAGTVSKIAEAVDGFGQLNVEINATKSAYEALIKGSTLNQLNNLLADAVKQSGAFHSSTEGAVGAAQRLVAVQREQAAEQKAINDLVRKAQGLRPQDVENRATNTYRTVQRRKQFEVEQQNRLNAELAEYQRLAEEVAAQTKRWADNLDRVARSSRAGALGSTSQIRTRLQAFRENRNSAEIARQRSAELLAQEAALRGSNYSLGQVPARGELLPGGNSATAQAQYRSMLNEQARIRAAAADALTRTETTLLGLQARTLQTESSISAVKRQQQSIDERSIAIAKERNRLLMEQFRAEQRNPNYGQPGNPGSTLDRRSRLISLRNQKAQGMAAAAQAENIALGVGFPLLFGGGAGTTLGSFAGSFVGSGFGGQILGGAVGQIVDQFIKSTTDLGKALLSPTNAFDVLKERALLSSRELERTADKLQEAGFAASASALAQQDFINSVGGPAVQDLQAAGQAGDRLARAFAQLGVQMQALAGGPIATLQNRFADVVGNQALMQRGSALSAQLIRAGRWQQADRLDASLLRISTSPNNAFGLNPAAVKAELEKAIAEASKGLPPVPIKLDPKQVREELINALSKQLDAIDTTRNLRNQVVAQQRAQEDADRQRYELVAASERTIADLRRSIEERVTQQRLANIQRENELLNVQAEIRLQSLRNTNIPLRNQFTNDRVSSAANAIADYLEQEQSIQNQIDQQKRDTALEIQRLSIETEQYKLQVATQVARLNEDNAKRIAEINRGIRRANADQDTRRFNLEKQIADIKLKGLQAEFALLSQQAGAFQNPQIQAAAAQGFDALKLQRDELAKLQAPGALREVGGVGQYGASTGGVDATSARATQLLGNIQAARSALLDLVRQGNFDTLKAQLDNALDKPLQKAANDAQNVWDALMGKGLGGQSTEAAQRNATLDEFINQLKQLQAESKNVRIRELLQEYINTAPGLALVADELRVTSDILGGLNSKYIELQDQLQALNSPYGELTQVQQVRNQLLREGISLESIYAQEVLRQASAVDALQEQVRVATQLQDVWRGVGGAMGEAMTTGLAAVVGGTQTAQQLFTSFLNAVADMLMRTAAQMISTYVAIGVARMFAGLGTPLGGSSFSAVPDFAGGLANSFTGNFGSGPGGLGSIAGGASMPSFAGGIQGGIAGFRASGGPVMGGKPYVVGERGPELFVPGRSGTVIPNNRLSAGGTTNVVVNVDAKGSEVQGNDTGANQLGRVISAAVQAELVRQKRPGGLLAAR